MFRGIPNPQLWLALINLAIHQADKATDPGEKEKGWKQASDYIDRAEQNLGDQTALRPPGARSPAIARIARRLHLEEVG